VASMGNMGAGSGMLVVETIAKIRRAYFAQKKPIKAICREFRVSRKVMRKVIRSEATEFRYERGRQPLPRIDPWRGQLDGLLLANEGKAARERLTLIRRRLRSYLWRQWQNGHNRFKELRRRGVPKFPAAVAAGSPTGFWRVSGHPVVQQALRNHHFDSLGLPRLHVAAQA